MDDKQYVYVVMGETGMWDDWRDWSVAAFTTRDAADAYVEQLDAWLTIHHCDKAATESLSLSERFDLTCDLDPSMSIDSNGVKYYVMPIELRGGR